MRRFTAMIVISLAACSSAGSVAQASALTDAFYANAKPNVVFLDESSRLALDHSTSRSVKRYAQDVATRETIVENSLVAWWQSNTQSGASAALGTTPERDPLASLDRLAGDLNQSLVKTGRSVGLDDQNLTLSLGAASASGAASPKSESQTRLLTSQQSDLDKLKGLRGRRFDAFYKVAQRNSLRQLVALYRDYAAQGDDPALRSIATLQLAKTNELIVRLNGVH